MQSEKTGKTFETQIESALVTYGYQKISWVEMKLILQNTSLEKIDRKLYAKNVPLGHCLYNYINKREEFLIYDPVIYPGGCILTAKWQQVPGTGYEKAPYLLLNILNYYPYPSIIVWDGNFDVTGVKAAYEYLKQYVDGKKILGVYTYNEFLQFGNRGGL